MSSHAAVSTFIQAKASARAEYKLPAEPGARTRAIGLLAIGLMLLALATANSVPLDLLSRSVPLYGFVLWVWWGCLGSALWTGGFRRPGIVGFAPAALAIHLVIGCALGVAHLLLLGSTGFINANYFNSTQLNE